MARYLLLIYFILPILSARAAPATPRTEIIVRRDNSTPFTGPSQVNTHNVIPVPGGTVTEDCLVTLTPIVVDGANLVEEVRKCTDVFNPGGSVASTPPAQTTSVSSSDNQSSTSTSDSTSSSTDSTAGSTTTDSASSDSSSTAGSTTTDSTSSDSSSTTDSTGSTATSSSNSSSTTSTSTSDSTSATSSASASTSSSSTASDSGSAAVTGGSTGSPGGPLQIIGPSSVAASATIPSSAEVAASATRASDQAANSSASGLPGKKLEVLPIGLGVFAGISVIALIVVGLVTYERTKYRKAFRQRRLAASGAEMGVGGMSERR